MTAPIDFTHPQTTDNYATAFVPAIIANQLAQAMWLDSNQTTYTAGLAQYMKRFNSTSLLFEQYSGTTWATLATNYAVLNAVNTFAAAGAPIVVNSTNSTNAKITFQDAGVVRGFVGADSTRSFFAINASNSIYTVQVDQSGNGTFAGTATATNFIGAGTGLTGTAASLTAGNASTAAACSGNAVTATTATTASTANALNIANTYQGTSFTALGNFNLQIVAGSGATWYKTMLGNDGSAIAYLLSSAVQTTQANAIAASYSSLRPLAWNMVTGAVTIDGTGAGITCGGTLTAVNVGITSDERLKNKWEPIGENLIDKIAGIKTGTYEIISSNSEQRRIGVSAQSLQSVMPEAVNENGGGYLSVSYGQAALVSVVELAKELIKLRQEIAELRGAK